MPKDDLVYVGHMLDSAGEALELLRGRSRTEFDSDKSLRLSLAHLFQTIGEAARRVSLVYQTAHPEIPWRSIIGIRHKVVHDYLMLHSRRSTLESGVEQDASGLERPPT